MATIRTAIQITDGMSPAFRSMNNAMNIVLNSFEALQTASSHAVDTASIQAARQELAKAETTFNDVEQEIRQADAAQRQLNNDIKNGQTAAGGLVEKIKGVVAAVAGYMAIQKGIEITDSYINQNARLALINDGLQTQAELQQKIFQAAQRSRGEYGATVDAVAKLGLLAKDAFKNNDEVIAFAELMNKSFRLSGSSTMEASAGMYQLTQAMAAGRLQGDEFRSIMENAPMLAQAIAKYAGKSMGELRKMSSEGLISADMVKNALFSAADDINAKFETMPMTFGTIWTSIKNKAVMQFSEIMQDVNDFINTDNGAAVVNGITNSINILAGVIGFLLSLVMTVTSFFTENWSWISPIIWGIVAAVVAYNGALIASSVIQGINTAIQTAQAIAIATKTGVTIAQAAATNNLTVAQWALNSAMLASPITWIVLLIIALIAVFYAAVAAVNKFAGTSVSATGIIAGVFSTMGAFLWDLFLGIFELVLGVINALVNPFIRIANFIGNVFTNPVSSIIYLFQGMADGVLATLEKIASAMDFVFGSNMADTVAGWRSGLKEMADAAVKEYAPNENYQKIFNELDLSVSDLGLKRIEYGDAYNAGYDFGKNVESKFDLSKIMGSNNLGDYADQMKFGSDMADTAANTAAMKDSMTASEEDLKYLRDMAEQEVVNRFTTAEVKVEMTNHNNINSEMDLDGVVAYFGEALEETIESIAEGADV